MKKQTKLFAILLSLTMLLSLLSSCGAKNFSPNEEDALDFGNVNNSYLPNAPSEDVEEEAENGGLIENPFVATAENPISTFSADVDTASYSYFRKLVGAKYSLSALKKTSASFRTEEFVNYFRYDVADPDEGELFGTLCEIAPCPWNPNSRLMRLTLQAEDAVECVGNNLVFLIDVSGSMDAKDKLELLKTGFSYLVDSLGENDTVSIVTYSGREEVVLDGCNGADRDRIISAIQGLVAYGSTNGEAGLSKAYQIAEKNMIEGGNNRIIMASDGDLNVGITSQEDLKSFIESKRDRGIYLSVMGFGSGNYRDAKMETLADNGNGVYYYIDGVSEAEKVLGSDLLGTLYTVAKDVKLQITFDPKFISSYRLIGYENRVLNTEDFEDDKKDAGDVGAGHQVTVCYELTLAEGAMSATEAWMKLAVRYKNPSEEISRLNEYGIGATACVSEMGEDLRFITCVIRTAMLLHNSRYSNGDTLDAIIESLSALELSAHPDRKELLDLLNAIADREG